MAHILLKSSQKDLKSPLSCLIVRVRCLSAHWIGGKVLEFHTLELGELSGVDANTTARIRDGLKLFWDLLGSFDS